MDKYSEFYNLLDEKTRLFKDIPKEKNIRVISHLDSDGICAASIITKALIRENRPHSVSIVSQLKENIIQELSNEKYDVFIFTDLGSGQIELIDKYLKDKTIFILDHHEINDAIIDNEKIHHINPHLFKINGSKEISGSGVVYLFAEKINDENKDLSHIPIIGAIGDNQENEGFEFLNNQILSTAIANKKINVEKGLKFFGLETKPLYKVLSNCTEPVIPGISGDDQKTIDFLESIDISPFIGNKARKFFNLTADEKEKLISALIIKRNNEENPEDILGNLYLIEGESDGMPTKDAREFSTLLNACGRLNRSSLGIGACLNNHNMKKKAIESLKDYKREIMNSINWYDRNKKDTDKIITGDNYIILKPKDQILETLIGTLTSIVSRNKKITPNTFIMSLAELEDGNMKVSIRIANCDNDTIDVNGIVKEITDFLGGESGGHKMAAGAIIDPELEDDFIAKAINIFETKYPKEIIINEIDD
ncbi:hypothetical protein C0585_03960 [Candidatus Woesearchaeota archaeon]|nr:MAG: hypothetical protein C0585_03960 [Candidatus Woesearchaeota archaeon]